MKTYKDYLIDFDALKVGQKLWSQRLGHCEIVSLNWDIDFPIKAVPIRDHYGYATYTKCGFERKDDLAPSLFKEKPDFFKERKEVKKWKWFYTYKENYRSAGVIENYYVTSFEYTEDEFLKRNHDVDMCKYEKIDCTEIIEVIYE